MNQNRFSARSWHQVKPFRFWFQNRSPSLNIVLPNLFLSQKLTLHLTVFDYYVLHFVGQSSPSLLGIAQSCLFILPREPVKQIHKFITVVLNKLACPLTSEPVKPQVNLISNFYAFLDEGRIQSKAFFQFFGKDRIYEDYLLVCPASTQWKA